MFQMDKLAMKIRLYSYQSDIRGLLPSAVIQQVLKEQGVSYRQTLYTPIVVVWAWISQVLDSDKSLSNAVSRIIASVSHRRRGGSLSRHRGL